MLLRIVWRLLAAALLLVCLIFFIALLTDLGQETGSDSLVASASAAARFTGGYLKNLLRGDMGMIPSRLGTSRGTPMVEALGRALPKSLGLLAVSLLLSAFVGLYLGVTAAVRRQSRVSGFVLFAATLGVSTPSYFAAMLLIWLVLWVYQSTGVHTLPLAGFGWDSHLLLPALVLGARPAAAVTRLSYNSLVDILEADYVRTAMSKGLRQNVILFRHVLRSAGVPILTTIGVSIRFSLAVLPIVEYIFSWPGIGQALLEAVEWQDPTVVIGLVLPFAALFVLVNLVLDVLYVRIDPRLRSAKAMAA